MTAIILRKIVSPEFHYKAFRVFLELFFDDALDVLLKCTTFTYLRSACLHLHSVLPQQPVGVYFPSARDSRNVSKDSRFFLMGSRPGMMRPHR